MAHWFRLKPAESAPFSAGADTLIRGSWGPVRSPGWKKRKNGRTGLETRERQSGRSQQERACLLAATAPNMTNTRRTICLWPDAHSRNLYSTIRRHAAPSIAKACTLYAGPRKRQLRSPTSGRKTRMSPAETHGPVVARSWGRFQHGTSTFLRVPH